MRVNSESQEMVLRASQVLDRWGAHVWTTQGFGMIRTYLDDAKRWRLNVWDDRLTVPGVSDIHDHPWDFTSYVLCGEIRNVRYKVAEQDATPFQHIQIRTGEEGGPIAPPGVVRLTWGRGEQYFPGESYVQRKDEIHRTVAARGTVTLNDRSPPTPEHTANVYWMHGAWVDAKPRLATTEEVYEAVRMAARQAQLLRQFGA